MILIEVFEWRWSWFLNVMILLLNGYNNKIHQKRPNGVFSVSVSHISALNSVVMATDYETWGIEVELIEKDHFCDKSKYRGIKRIW